MMWSEGGSRKRLVRALLAMLFLSVICVAIVQTALREPLAVRSPAGRSLLLVADAFQRGKDPATLNRTARDLAVRYPLEAASFYLKGAAIQARTAEADIGPLMREAQRRQPAFVAPRMWIVGDSVRRGDDRQAIVDADIVMRVKPSLRPLLLPLVIPYLNKPETREQLIGILATYPVWRSNFLSLAIDSDVDRASLERVLLQQSPPSRPASSAADQSRLLMRLVDAGDVAEAWSFYTRLKPGAAANPIQDGKFRDEEQIRPFSWWLASEAGSYATRIAPPKAPPFLRVHHNGHGEQLLVEQRLVLPRGRWRFTINQRSAGLADPATLKWQLTCGDDRVLAESGLRGLGETWSRSEMTALVGGADCALQRLRLLGLADDGKEMEVEVAEISASRL